MKKEPVIIIGAGIGGLTAAYRLREKGYRVEILEASSRPGGRMKRLERKGDIVDVGTQFFHSNFTIAWRLINEMGLSATRRKTGGKIRYQFIDGSSFEYDNRFFYLKLLKLRGNLRLYRFIMRHIVFGNRFIPFRIGDDIPSSDKIGVLDFFKSDEEQSFRDYIVAPLCAASNSASPEWMSLYHFIRMFQMCMTRYIGLTGGISSLADALAQRLPVRYETPVKNILVEKGAVVGVLMQDGSTRKAAHVISAVDAASAASTMPDELSEQRLFFEGVPYSSLPMPVILLDRPLRDDVWSYWNDPRLNRPFKFVIDERAKVPEMFPSGKSVLTAWPVYPETIELMKKSDDVLIKQAREDIELMIPGVSGYIEDALVIRHPFTAELFPGGAYRRTADFIRQSRSLKGVSFVSALFGGCSMEAAMASAEDAVKTICRDARIQ